MNKVKFMWQCNYINSDELYHHGVKGQKHGKRRYQNKDGTYTELGKQRRRIDGVRRLKYENGDPVLKKRTIVRRVSLTKDDPIYDNKKYVSITRRDNRRWENFLGESYINGGTPTYKQTYRTTKNIRIMDSAKQGELYTKMLMDSKFKKQSVKDLDYAYKLVKARDDQKFKDPSKEISFLISRQTKTGKNFVQKVLADNYDAVADTFGTNVAEFPVIIFNPDKNLKKVGRPKPTIPYKEYLKENKRR